MSTYNMCDIISFTYNSPGATDRTPIVLVVTPRWNGNMHGINLKNLPSRERAMLMKISNPNWSTSNGYLDKIPALKKIIDKRVASNMNIGSYDFYYKYVAGFARRYNCYRIYKPLAISNVNVLDYDKVRF
jgi:hypothetical protein